MATLSAELTQTLDPDFALYPEAQTHINRLATEQNNLGTLPMEVWPQVDHLITEDDTPVDNIFSEKQQRLLTESLYTSWSGPGGARPFLTLANVGLFYSVYQPPIVPDVLLSLDAQLPKDLWAKSNRSYMVWQYGKAPEVVIEIVSNKKGGETDRKLHTYGQLGIVYYVVYDPSGQLGDKSLRLYERHLTAYIETEKRRLPDVGLGLTEWRGIYEGTEAAWLRWLDQNGDLLLTGAERAEQEGQRAEQERQRAEQERQRAEQERQHSKRLRAQLQALGIDPEV